MLHWHNQVCSQAVHAALDSNRQARIVVQQTLVQAMTEATIATDTVTTRRHIMPLMCATLLLGVQLRGFTRQGLGLVAPFGLCCKRNGSPCESSA